MSEHSAHLTSLPFGFRTSWLWRYACLLLLISMLWHRQSIFESKGDRLSYYAECRIRTWKSQDTSRLIAHSQTDWAIEDQAKTWTQQPVPMMSDHSAHLTSLPFGFRTWLWRYTTISIKLVGNGRSRDMNVWLRTQEFCGVRVWPYFSFI